MMKEFILKQINKLGYDVVKKNKRYHFPTDFEHLHIDIITKVKKFSMTSPERLFGLIEAVKYVCQFNIEGEIVECGVWKGGSMLAIAETLHNQNNVSKNLYLYDTFEGMPPPSEADRDFEDHEAKDLLEKSKNKEESAIWAYAPLETVKHTMSLSKYPKHKIKYIQGKIEETIPMETPEKISLLRLDTDWYESTKHELIHLFPRLVKGGVLIIDDYGFWKGAKKAVDEYLQENKIQILLNRLDETGRIAIKQ